MRYCIHCEAKTETYRELGVDKCDNCYKPKPKKIYAKVEQRKKEQTARAIEFLKKLESAVA